MIEFNRFTEKDWDAFCGCENFMDGNEPLIGHFKVWHAGYAFDWTVVADGGNIQVLDPETDRTYMVHRGEEVNAIFKLNPSMKFDQVQNMINNGELLLL